ncbi:MAG TPA: hypothetical protein DCX07_15180 [Phycisphaerales bacterium]|nr:hypothetical protein [Phycisphaerales bacterium]
MQLAREAMLRYLARRTPAAEQPIPPDLRALDARQYPVAVTLRSRGTVLARAIRAEASTARNLFAAALEAMRSPALPDRVTRQVIESLTIEVEVLSAPTAAVADQVDSFYVAALTGLRLDRGLHTAYVLPSTAYLLDADAESVRRGCLVQIPLDRSSTSNESRWSIFASRQFVGYADGQTVALYRGKILVPPEVIDDKLLSDAAGQVAAYLARRQSQTGLYQTDWDTPGLRDHLYAAWAMARLAKRTGSSLAAASANRALGAAMLSLKTDDERGYVAAGDADDQLAATSLMLLTLIEMPDSPQASAVRKQLVNALLAGIRPDGMPLSRLDGQGKTAASLPDACLALAALQSAGVESARLAPLRGALAKVTPGDAEGLAWKLRVGLPMETRDAPLSEAQKTALLPRQADETALPDERGGFAPPNAAPSVALTGLWAQHLARALPELRKLNPPEPAARAAAQLLAARRFCYQLLYKPREAYFSEHLDELPGAARESATSARATVRSCAAALDAFLAVPE